MTENRDSREDRPPDDKGFRRLSFRHSSAFFRKFGSLLRNHQSVKESEEEPRQSNREFKRRPFASLRGSFRKTRHLSGGAEEPHLSREDFDYQKADTPRSEDGGSGDRRLVRADRPTAGDGADTAGSLPSVRADDNGGGGGGGGGVHAMDSDVSSSTGTPFRGRARLPGPLDTSTLGTSSPSHMSQSEVKTPTTSTTAPLTPIGERGPGHGGSGERNAGGGSRPPEKEKLGHRRIDDEGKVTFKKIHSSTIIESIQLGIGYAVGSLASKPERDLLMQDFAMVDNLDFPKEGGPMSPAHHHDSFKFKAYSPVAFRYFRDLFQIPPGDFLLSLCNEAMRELSNPGASGSLFYVTADDEFIIKTVAHVEADFLQSLLPGYYMNLHQNPRTLLPKFFGLYCYIASGKNVRVIVMNNLLPSSVKMHLKYDLKGSTYKRKANKAERQKKSPTFKDLDFMEHHPEGILLDAQTYDALINTIQRDCRVLESFKIMDYSLLLGIHNIDQAMRETEAADSTLAADGASSGCLAPASNSGANIPRSKSMNRGRLAAFSTAIESIDHDDNSPPGGIPATNSKGEHLLLFIGIIDILQSYRLRKKLEHSWKALLHDGDTVSVHRPGFYAKRFQEFMSQKVFKRMASPLKHTPSKKNPKLVTVVRRVMQEKHDNNQDAGLTAGLQTQQQTGSTAPPSTPVPHAASKDDDAGREGHPEGSDEVQHDGLGAGQIVVSVREEKQSKTEDIQKTSQEVVRSEVIRTDRLEETKDGGGQTQTSEVIEKTVENTTNGGTITTVSVSKVSTVQTVKDITKM